MCFALPAFNVVSVQLYTLLLSRYTLHNERAGANLRCGGVVCVSEKKRNEINIAASTWTTDHHTPVCVKKRNPTSRPYNYVCVCRYGILGTARRSNLSSSWLSNAARTANQRTRAGLVERNARALVPVAKIPRACM